ncbi:MAG: thiamine pyrophosphate-binding protein, partial [Bacteroidota bacterium]
MKSTAIKLMPQWLWDQGVRHAVLCPGSRSAPLTLAIARSELMEIFTGVDERAAGFAALGLSLGTGRPVVVVCTSGTALLNLGPAVAEAYYLRLPLLILSADRPAGYEGQQRGQVIRQDGALDHHLRASFRWAPDEPEWDLRRSENLFEQALRTAVKECGPVHINIPLDEPLFDLVELEHSGRNYSSTGPNNALDARPHYESVPEELQVAIHQALAQGKRIWFLAGMDSTHEALEPVLTELEGLEQICLWREDLANLKVGLPLRDEWFRTAPIDPPALLIS